MLGVAVVLVAFPWIFQQPYPRDVMIRIFLYALLAQAWNLLGGYCGQVSLGSAVFFGIGAYTSCVLSLWWGVSPWLGMLAGMHRNRVLQVLVRLPAAPDARPAATNGTALPDADVRSGSGA